MARGPIFSGVFIFQYLDYHSFNYSVISPSKIEPNLTISLIFEFQPSLSICFSCAEMASEGMAYVWDSHF